MHSIWMGFLHQTYTAYNLVHEYLLAVCNRIEPLEFSVVCKFELCVLCSFSYVRYIVVFSYRELVNINLDSLQIFRDYLQSGQGIER